MFIVTKNTKIKLNGQNYLLEQGDKITPITTITTIKPTTIKINHRNTYIPSGTTLIIENFSPEEIDKIKLISVTLENKYPGQKKGWYFHHSKQILKNNEEVNEDNVQSIVDNYKVELPKVKEQKQQEKQKEKDIDHTETFTSLKQKIQSTDDIEFLNNLLDNCDQLSNKLQEVLIDKIISMDNKIQYGKIISMDNIELLLDNYDQLSNRLQAILINKIISMDNIANLSIHENIIYDLVFQYIHNNHNYDCNIINQLKQICDLWEPTYYIYDDYQDNPAGEDGSGFFNWFVKLIESGVKPIIDGRFQFYYDIAQQIINNKRWDIVGDFVLLMPETIRQNYLHPILDHFANNNQWDVVKKLIHEPYGLSPCAITLTRAAEDGQWDIVDKLINEPYNLKLDDDDDDDDIISMLKQPQRVASHQLNNIIKKFTSGVSFSLVANWDFVNILINRGATPDHGTLQYAVEGQQWDLVDKLISEYNLKLTQQLMQDLHWDVVVVDKLISEYNVKPNQNTLRNAVRDKQWDLVNKLISEPYNLTMSLLSILEDAVDYNQWDLIDKLMNRPGLAIFPTPSPYNELHMNILRMVAKSIKQDERDLVNKWDFIDKLINKYNAAPGQDTLSHLYNDLTRRSINFIGNVEGGSISHLYNDLTRRSMHIVNDNKYFNSETLQSLQTQFHNANTVSEKRDVARQWREIIDYSSPLDGVLLYAARDGQWDFVNKLMNEYDSEPCCEGVLYYAMADDQWDFVDKIMDKPYNIKPNQRTLDCAAEDKRWDLVDKLISEPHNLKPNQDILYEAMADDQWDLVNKLNIFNITPLELSVMKAMDKYDQEALTYVRNFLQLFGHQWKKWLTTRHHNKYEDIHTAINWIGDREEPPQDKQGFLRYIFKYSHIPIRDLRTIYMYWENVKTEWRQLAPKLIIKELLSIMFEGIIINNEDLALEAFYGGVLTKSTYSDDIYPELEERWLKSLDAPSPFPTNQEWTYKDYIGKFLPRDDPRGLFLGIHTDCCQHPQGVSPDSAWYGQEEPNAGFFIIERKGKIIVQSMVWLTKVEDSNKRVLVFDNIETLGKQSTEIVLGIYKDVAKDMKRELGIDYVNIGKDYSKVSLQSLKDAASGVDYGELLSDAHRDAEFQVRLEGLVTRCGVIVGEGGTVLVESGDVVHWSNI